MKAAVPPAACHARRAAPLTPKAHGLPVVSAHAAGAGHACTDPGEAKVGQNPGGRTLAHSGSIAQLPPIVEPPAQRHEVASPDAACVVEASADVGKGDAAGHGDEPAPGLLMHGYIPQLAVPTGACVKYRGRGDSASAVP